MIRKMIETLKVIRVYFLLKDCKKMAKKYYGKKADEFGKSYGKDADRLFDKYKDDVKASKIVIDTLTLIEAYDKEAYEKRTAEFEKILNEVKNENAPDSAATPSKGDATR